MKINCAELLPIKTIMNSVIGIFSFVVFFIKSISCIELSDIVKYFYIVLM